MNINDAKAIPLYLVLEQLGYKPIKEKKGETVYFSPLRLERTPSFHVNNGKNAWFDFGEGRGGNVIDFACAYLAAQKGAHTVSDALRWLSNTTGTVPAIAYVPPHQPVNREPCLVIRQTTSIKHKALTSYLAKRGIPLKLATPYLVELTVLNKDSGKSFFALGLPNEEGGHELRNPFFKGSAGTKAISFIRGAKTKPDGIHLFEGMFDFLSVLAQQNVKALQDDAIILNSLSCLKQSFSYIKNYGYRTAFTWLDNDKPGAQASLKLAAFFQSEDGLRHRPMNSVYRQHKDVNAWHVGKGCTPQ